MSTLTSDLTLSPLTQRQRYLILAAGFLAWLFAGMELSMFVLAGDAATIDLLAHAGSVPNKEMLGSWFNWYVGSVMLGAATGGWMFGALGDHFGRTRAMAWAVLCYSFVTGASYFVTAPSQLLVLRFVVGMGIGGVWPNAVSLAAEAWPNASRPFLAGLLGTAANGGFVLLGAIGMVWLVTTDSWRWITLLGAAPTLLGIFILSSVSESPKWLASRRRPTNDAAAPMPLQQNPILEVFRPPLLQRTLLGILLGAIPLVGNAANGNWAVFWAGQAQHASAGASTQKSQVNPRDAAYLKAKTQVQRSSGGFVGSLIGGWITVLLGRRMTYFFACLLYVTISSYLFGALAPGHPQFAALAFSLGLVGNIFFGWLPLYLPELFPTRVRATGIGVCFNSGRVFAAIFAILGTTGLIKLFDGDFARVGVWTGAIYAVGMIIILFAPSTGGKKLED